MSISIKLKDGVIYREVPFEVMMQCDGPMMCDHDSIQNPRTQGVVHMKAPMEFNHFLILAGTYFTKMNLATVFKEAKWYAIDDGIQLEEYKQLQAEPSEYTTRTMRTGLFDDTAWYTEASFDEAMKAKTPIRCEHSIFTDKHFRNRYEMVRSMAFSKIISIFEELLTEDQINEIVNDGKWLIEDPQ